MKQGYEKPMIYFESFELDTAICSCGAGANGGSSFGIPQQGSPTTCAYFNTVSNIGIFSGDPCLDTDPNDGKTYQSIPEGTDGSIYCYHQPTDDKRVFAS
ncbi:MAG: hypothetical protein Q4F21_02735 [Lachnospiraceae bacterium]|nr:hypothetical protein [Lachnospiraceae bacterium]